MGPFRNADHPCVQSVTRPYPAITMHWSPNNKIKTETWTTHGPSPKSGPPMVPVRNPDHPCVQSGTRPYPAITVNWSHQTGPFMDPDRNPGPPMGPVRNLDHPWTQTETWNTHGPSPEPGHTWPLPGISRIRPDHPWAQSEMRDHQWAQS